MSKCGSQLSFESGMTPRHLTLWPKSTLLLPMRSHPYKISVGIIPASQKIFFFGLERSWGQPQGPNFPSPWATMLALRLDCFTAALTTPQKILPIWKLVDLKMLDFSDRTRTGISILTSAAELTKKTILAIFFYPLDAGPIQRPLNYEIFCTYLSNGTFGHHFNIFKTMPKSTICIIVKK